jgi:PiT family inorganic phosphate transporter
MGVGTSGGLHAVHWGVARSILIAWVVTIPAAAGVAALVWLILNALGLH